MKLEATTCRRVLDGALRLSIRPSADALLFESQIEPTWQARRQISSQNVRSLNTQAAEVQRDVPRPPLPGSRGSAEKSLKEALKRNKLHDPQGFARPAAGAKQEKTVLRRVLSSEHAKRSKDGFQRDPAAKVNRGKRNKQSRKMLTTSKSATARKDDQSESKGPLDDEPIVLVPTQKDYPKAPRNLFTDPHPTWWALSRKHIETKEEMKRVAKRRSQCTITCQVISTDAEPVSETAVAYGMDGKSARTEATRRLLAKLHHSGILSKLYSGDQSDLPLNMDAVTDVYNYCARNFLCPTIKTEHVPGINEKRDLVQVTITLPEENICVQATRLNLQAAQVAASNFFKQAAENFHAERGENLLVVKDSSALTLATCRAWIEYYKTSHPAYFDVKSEEMKHYKGHNGLMAWHAQAYFRNEPIGQSVKTYGKRSAVEELAHLTGAVALAQENPDKYKDFQRAKKSSTGKTLPPVRTMELEIDERVEEAMRSASRAVRNSALRDMDDVVPAKADTQDMTRRPRRSLDVSTNEWRSEAMKKQQSNYSQDPRLAELRAKKSDLPMNQYRGKVLDLISNNIYSIVVGATGSGKTTQVPQILLEDSIGKGTGALTNIICTQPRRIAATSVAQRVAVERDEQLQDTIGYQVRFDAKLPRNNGSVTYCTTGILLAQLQNSPDDILDSTSHIIIDEVHERDIIIDYLMITLKKLMEVRRMENKFVPKVVLMSATLDTELFAGYFKQQKEDGTSVPCPSLSVPGRTFPVKEKYVDNILDELRAYPPHELNAILSPDKVSHDFIKNETALTHDESLEDDEIANSPIDWKRRVSNDKIDTSQDDAKVPVSLVAATIAHIARTTSEGAILAFLPGLEEIKKVRDQLDMKPLGVDFSDVLQFKSYMLHSSIQRQGDVFSPVPPGCRKVILATNIAETSVTIPDVQYVVDTGKLKEKRYDQTSRITQLLTTWVSKSNSRQRAGRAGRVQNGNYYALFSKARFASFRAIGLPEMLRSDLQEICLDIKAQAFKAPVREFLASAIEPPAASAVDASILNLQALGAITEDEELTPLGKVLAKLPIHPSLSKMILLGIIFRCFDPMLILGASSQGRSLFYSPIDNKRGSEEARRTMAAQQDSDHLALINCYRIARQMRDEQGDFALQRFAQEYFMSIPAFLAIERTMDEIENILVQAGVLPFTPLSERFRSQCGHAALNVNSTNTPLIKALILAGAHPNIGVATGMRVLQTPSERDAILAPNSLNYLRDKNDRLSRGAIFTFSTMSKSSDGSTLYLKETSAVTPLMAALFGGHAPRLTKDKMFTIDEWLPFYVKRPGGFFSKSSRQALSEFKSSLDTVLSHAFSSITKKSDGKNHLADDPVLEKFSRGFVEVLDKDVSGGDVFERGKDRIAERKPSLSNLMSNANSEGSTRSIARWRLG